MINKPTIFREGKYNQKDINDFKKKTGFKVIDIYSNQSKELFEVQNPRITDEKELKKKFPEFEEERKKESSGDWIYYEWNNTFLHTLTEKENDSLRTNRNKNIITAEEQKKLANFTVAIAGLSVGGNIATTLAYNGFSKNIKIADFDTLATTNLNRVRGKLSDVGSAKIEIISRQLYELDPYVNIIAFDKGLNKKNISEFLAGIPKTNLVFEIIDNLPLKILIRKEAKKHKIPVVMLTSIGNSVLIDIERYDQDPKTKIFNGMVDEKILEYILADKIPKSEVNKYVMEIVGPENIPPRVVESVKSIGKTLVGRPQLMSTVTITSGIACFIARKIALGDKVTSGRKIFKFDDLLNS
ncbi:MAG: ThiF family adenylyltransferase [Nanoarchaeota archaeon]